jgi:hypothetical protein
MAESKNKSKRITEIIVTMFIIVGLTLILADMATNVVYEINSGNQMEAAVQVVTPTPKPTLTLEEREEMYNKPVNEAGD